MATGATEFIDHTTADVFLVEVWSQEAILAREQALVYAGLVNRVFEKDVLKFGDTIHVPSRTHLTAQAKALSTNAAIVYETITESNTNISVATWEYTAIAVETALQRQANRDMLAFYAPEQGYALALSVDDVLAGLPDDFTQAVGTLAFELTYDDVLRADQYLNDANAPMGDRRIVVAPAQKAGFMKIDQYINDDYSKLQDGAKKGLKDSYLGSWMGYPVHCSTNAEGSNAAGHDGAMFHKEALALVLQMKPTTHKFMDVDYLANKVVVEQLHGSAEMRDDHGVWLKSA